MRFTVRNPIKPSWRWIALFGLTLACVVVVTSAARAELRVDITRGNVEPLPIAIPDFYGASGEKRKAVATSPR